LDDSYFVSATLVEYPAEGLRTEAAFSPQPKDPFYGI
jgi:hypothetical protein